MDLAEAVSFDHAAAEQSIYTVAPEMTIQYVSSKTGAGMDRWLEFLLKRQSDFSGGLD
jgi:hydrogenase nickel incorporation protein HypB